MSEAAPRAVNVMAIGITDDFQTPPGARARSRRLGPLLGGQLLGATVYELDRGGRTAAYHHEIGNEECVLVLAGTPTLRHPEGRDVLEVGDMVPFTDGPTGAHQLINESDTVARVLILSTTREPCERAYPDSAVLQTQAGVFRIADAVEDWDGESAG